MADDGKAGWNNTAAETTGDAMIAAMSEGGIDHMFFTSGSEIGFFQEAIAKAKVKGHNKPIKLITVPHEHANLNAALGFAAVSGRPAATAAHVDCGTQHYGGAVHTAWRSGLPVLITAGFPPTAFAGTMKGSREEGGHLWMQETYDQNGIVRNYVKWDHRLSYQDNPGLIVSRALQVARSEPCGPVYLSFPKELTFLNLEDARFPTVEQLGIPRPAAPDPAGVSEIVKKLAKAKNPVAIVSGSGRNPETLAALVELSELLGLAVVDSAHKAYLCFPFKHPLYQTQDALQKADAVLIIDVDVPWIPGHNTPPANAFVAAVSHDPIKQRIPTYEFSADVRLVADPLQAILSIKTAARKIIRKTADKSKINSRKKRLNRLSTAWHKANIQEAKGHATETPIHPLWLSYQIGKLVDDNCIVLDETLPANRVRDFLPNAVPGSYLANTGSSGGWSPGAALGAKIAAPDRDVIAVTGDGFYMFGTPSPAIWAAAQHDAPFMTVIYTNRSYTTGTSAVVRSFGKDSYAAKEGFVGGYFDPPIDFAKEAEAAGAYGETVYDPADLSAALKRGLEQIRKGKPAVISVWLKRLEGKD